MCLLYLQTHLVLPNSLLLIDQLSCHVGVAAFEVEDAAAMEARLVFFGIEYTKVYVPDTDAAQLFFFDPGADPAMCCFTAVYPLHFHAVSVYAAGLTLKQTSGKPSEVSRETDLACI